MNQLKVGTRVFNIACSDGKAHPTHYLLEEKGIVDRIKVYDDETSVVGWGSMSVFKGKSSDRFLKPSSDGFCYFVAELPNMEQYKDINFYKVPVQVLKAHMKSYKSPWET